MVNTHPKPADPWLYVDVGRQRVCLMQGDDELETWPASTAEAGLGEANGSLQTPRGWHCVRAKIGGGLPQGAVFRGRRWTGEICDQALYEGSPGRDWILSRILWLSGLEKGLNRLGSVDTMRRYIYLHGCPDPVPLGKPLSKGCVRMRNADIVSLYERVPAGMRVLIE